MVAFNLLPNISIIVKFIASSIRIKNVIELRGKGERGGGRSAAHKKRGDRRAI